MRTHYLKPDEIDRAAHFLLSDELVAFPTETVYGLGANALSASAVQKIFEAKGRPSDNPLIVHLASIEQLHEVVREIPEEAFRLMEAFWPGPLTLVLPKQIIVPDCVTAGLDTVAVRIPSHPIAHSILRKCGMALAAPSANRSGRPSATTWQSVAEDLDGRIAAIVCGDPTQFGLESTVVDLSCTAPRLLRHGGITLEQLRNLLPNLVVFDGKPQPSDGNVDPVNSPGLRHKHYQPIARVVMVGDGNEDRFLEHYRVWFLGLRHPLNPNRYSQVHCFQDVEQYAAQLFDLFRKADRASIEQLHCEIVPESGIGAALMDRLRRASEE